MLGSRVNSNRASILAMSSWVMDHRRLNVAVASVGPRSSKMSWTPFNVSRIGTPVSSEEGCSVKRNNVSFGLTVGLSRDECQQTTVPVT